MTRTKLEQIKTSMNDSKLQAEQIMDGGDNYDGADGAREVLQLCRMMQSLIGALEPLTENQEAK